MTQTDRRKPRDHIDITDRNADYNFINKETWRAELGLRAIAIMYDEHSNDKKIIKRFRS